MPQSGNTTVAQKKATCLRDGMIPTQSEQNQLQWMYLPVQTP